MGEIGQQFNILFLINSGKIYIFYLGFPMENIMTLLKFDNDITKKATFAISNLGTC